MILESLKALIIAGEDALIKTCGLPVTDESITQIRHGELTFPCLAEIKIVRGVLQQVHLGASNALTRHVHEAGDADPAGAGAEVLARNFLNRLLSEMDARNPKGQVENVGIGPISLCTRGVRSFGFRLETDAGQLFLMAEVPSKIEMETAKGSEFLTSMAATYLPKEWQHRDHLASRGLIDSLLVFLRKVEGDVEFDFTQDGDEPATPHHGFLLGTTRVEGQAALKMSVDLGGAAAEPVPGQELVGRFGVMDRSFEFPMKYLGRQSHPVAGNACLDCVLFSVPDEVQIRQRRSAFRINCNQRIEVEIERAEESDNPEYWLLDPENRPVTLGRLADLSFSGARIVTDWQQAAPVFREGSRILCSLHFPGERRPLQISGVVRRATSTLADRNEMQDELGIEFLVTPGMDRLALDYIRQFVLTEQRSWLSRRVHVAGVGSW